MGQQSARPEVDIHTRRAELIGLSTVFTNDQLRTIYSQLRIKGLSSSWPLPHHHEDTPLDSTLLVKMLQSDFVNLMTKDCPSALLAASKRTARHIYQALDLKIDRLIKINAECDSIYTNRVGLLVDGFVRNSSRTSSIRVPTTLWTIIADFAKMPRTTREVKLKVHQHNGHAQPSERELRDLEKICYSPSNMLQETKGSWYRSFDTGDDDSIVFEICEDTLIIPNKVSFRFPWFCPIPKGMSWSIGTGDGRWHKLAGDWVSTRPDARRSEYVFDELCVAPQWIWENKARFIRMSMSPEASGTIDLEQVILYGVAL